MSEEALDNRFMPPPRMGKDDVGAFYVRRDGSIWRFVGYAAEPTATLERVWRDQVTSSTPSIGQRVGGVIGAPIFGGFQKLVAE